MKTERVQFIYSFLRNSSLLIMTQPKKRGLYFSALAIILIFELFAGLPLPPSNFFAEITEFNFVLVRFIWSRIRIEPGERFAKMTNKYLNFCLIKSELNMTTLITIFRADR